MDNYGDPVLDKNNNLIGYKWIKNKYASISTYYNENNLLCNKVEIRGFNFNTLTFSNDILTHWIDIKTESGFTREHNKIKYFFNSKNNLINAEVNFTYPQFLLS